MIYFFGSSHTAGMYNPSNPEYETYTHIPYSVRLAKKLNMEYKNLAKGGSLIDRNSFLLTQDQSGRPGKKTLIIESTNSSDPLKAGEVISFIIGDTRQ